LFLIGMMGSGKSTLGRQLARVLRKRFIDADAEIEAQMGVTIATVFEVEGEECFRDREEAVLKRICQEEGVVLATGGGAVIRADNRRLLRENGTVVYLHAEPQTLWNRTKSSRHRPLLRTEDPRATLEVLYAARDPLYREAAHLVVNAERTHTAQLLSALSQFNSGREGD
jgi:shikimate kinase